MRKDMYQREVPSGRDMAVGAVEKSGACKECSLRAVLWMLPMPNLGFAAAKAACASLLLVFSPTPSNWLRCSAGSGFSGAR